MYMTEIDPKKIKDALTEVGISRWKMAHLLNPLMSKQDAYRTFKRWMDLGRMPVYREKFLWSYIKSLKNSQGS